METLGCLLEVGAYCIIRKPTEYWTVRIIITIILSDNNDPGVISLLKVVALLGVISDENHRPTTTKLR